MAAEFRRRRWWFFLPLLLLPASAGGSEVSPEAIKATYILQMQKFVSLGEPPRTIQKICYYERQRIPLEESVGQIIEKYVKTHASDKLPSVKRFEAIRDLSGCDIFYIPADEEGNIDSILAALGSSQTLTISAAKRFIYRGGMVGFVLDEDNRVKMESNLKNVKSKNIRIDAQLLEIMLRVINQ